MSKPQTSFAPTRLRSLAQASISAPRRAAGDRHAVDGVSPEYVADFVAREYRTASGSAFTCARSGSADYTDAAGATQTAGPNILRVGHHVGGVNVGGLVNVADGDALDVPAAALPWSADGVTIAIEGLMTYEDTGLTAQVRLVSWGQTNFERIRWDLNTAAGRTGEMTFIQFAGGVVDQVATAATYSSPGTNVPFAMAARHGPSSINAALDGVALVESATPTAMPDLSALTLRLAQIGGPVMISRMRVWGRVLTDAQLEAATVH